MSSPLPPESRLQGARAHPRKRRGEHFSEYWQRISDAEAIAITRASRFINITPQSLFVSYIRYEDE